MNTNKINGLVIWDEVEIKKRAHFIDIITTQFQSICELNKAWVFKRIECPTIIPIEDIHPNYSKEDFFQIGDGMALRPETTRGSYDYLRTLMPTGIERIPPICIYQAGLSFRNEQDKTLKHMRLKQFYQLEYQFIYTKESKADYVTYLTDKTFEILSRIFPGKLFTAPSDRLPGYSGSTTDICYQLTAGEMEICSMSKRLDAPHGLSNFEVAIGLDRLVYLENV